MINRKHWLPVIVIFFAFIISFACAQAPNGIYGNGTWGLYIDINSSPYTDYSQASWGQYAYGTSGCAWFATSRLTQITGKNYTIWDGKSWWDSQYSAYGFTRGTDDPTGKALICYSNHIAVWEASNDDKVLVSQGGDTWYNGYGGGNAADYGYCSIREMTRDKVRSYTSGFLGFVYLGINQAPTGITINSTNFPDTNFRNYVKGEVDRDKNGYLSDKEIKKTVGIECYFCSISSMKGIEYFTELESLNCVGNNLTKLDVSKCAKLRNLECGANKLTSLQVNSKLTYLDCGDNKLSGLNVRSCSKLETLLCEDNQLTSLDVSKNTRLYCLQCENNKLSSLNVSKNTKLGYLYCYNNRFITLDVSKCTVLAKYVKKESRGIGTEFDYFGLWIDDDGEYSEFRLTVDKTVTVKAGSTTRKASVINVKYKNGNYRLSGSTATLTGVTDKNLTSFTVADNIKDDGKTYKVTKIAASACKGLSKLTKLNIGKNVKEIGKNAFSNCKKLKTINFKGTALKKIGSDAFKNIAKKATFNIPQKVYKNYKKLIKDAGTSSAEYRKD